MADPIEKSDGVTETVTGVADRIGDTANVTTNAVWDSARKMLGDVIEFVPLLVAAAVVLIIGYFVARYLGRVVTMLCDRLGLQRATDRSELGQSMKQVGIQRTVPEIVGLIVFWLLICVFLMAAFNILQLPGVETAMQKLVEYIPNVLGATVIVVLGLLVASFLRGIIATSTDRLGLSYAQQLATGCYWILSLMIFMAAFKQLQLEFDLLNYAILIVLAGAALGLGLAFGLGGREVVGGILAGYYIRQRMQAGDPVSIANMQGTVRDVGPVATIVETEENGLVHRHSVPNTRMLNEAIR